MFHKRPRRLFCRRRRSNLWAPTVMHKKEKRSQSAVKAYPLIYEAVKWVWPAVSFFMSDQLPGTLTLLGYISFSITPFFVMNSGRPFSPTPLLCTQKAWLVTIQSLSCLLLLAQWPSYNFKLRANTPSQLRERTRETRGPWFDPARQTYATAFFFF